MKNIFIILILVSVSENLAISITKIQQNKPEQRILLRKLQNIQQSDSKDSKSTTWNEILADVLINKIKIFSLKEPTIELIDTDNDSGGNNKIVTKCFSQLLKFYKTYIYDRHLNKSSFDIFSAENQDFTPDTTTVPDTDQDFKSNNNPKDEVELIEPAYHGKFQVNSTSNVTGTKPTYNHTDIPDTTDNNEMETATEEEEEIETAEEITSTEKSQVLNETTRDTTDTITGTNSTPEDVETFDAMSDANFTVCPNELVLIDGQCVSPLSKLILSIPFQCPAGYRKDRWGYCRLIF